jgi:hypothetical protein
VTIAAWAGAALIAVSLWKLLSESLRDSREGGYRRWVDLSSLLFGSTFLYDALVPEALSGNAGFLLMTAAVATFAYGSFRRHRAGEARHPAADRKLAAAVRRTQWQLGWVGLASYLLGAAAIVFYARQSWIGWAGGALGFLGSAATIYIAGALPKRMGLRDPRTEIPLEELEAPGTAEDPKALPEGRAEPLAQTAVRAPFRVTLDFMLELSPPQDRQAVHRVLDRGRGGQAGTRLPADSLMMSLREIIPEIYGAVMLQRDSLLLTTAQLAALQKAQAEYQPKARAVWRELAEWMATQPDDYDAREVVRRLDATVVRQWELLKLERPKVLEVLTPVQRSLLPAGFDALLYSTKRVPERFTWQVR